jgi:hypothetical protein
MSEFDKNEGMSAGGEYAYKSVMGEKNKTRLWSVISLSLAVLALVLCFLGWVGMALCTIALAFAIVSRKMLGYFDRITLASLIVSIFAMVFSIVFTVMNSIS